MCRLDAVNLENFTPDRVFSFPLLSGVEREIGIISTDSESQLKSAPNIFLGPRGLPTLM